MESTLPTQPSVSFEVEEIIGVSVGVGNVKNYCVRWAPTWISGMNLVGCEILINEFLRGQEQIEINPLRATHTPLSSQKPPLQSEMEMDTGHIGYGTTLRQSRHLLLSRQRRKPQHKKMVQSHQHNRYFQKRGMQQQKEDQQLQPQVQQPQLQLKELPKLSGQQLQMIELHEQSEQSDQPEQMEHQNEPNDEQLDLVTHQQDYQSHQVGDLQQQQDIQQPTLVLRLPQHQGEQSQEESNAVLSPLPLNTDSTSSCNENNESYPVSEGDNDLVRQEGVEKQSCESLQHVNGEQFYQDIDDHRQHQKEQVQEQQQQQRQHQGEQQQQEQQQEQQPQQQLLEEEEQSQGQFQQQEHVSSSKTSDTAAENTENSETGVGFSTNRMIPKVEEEDGSYEKPRNTNGSHTNANLTWLSKQSSSQQSAGVTAANTSIYTGGLSYTKPYFLKPPPPYRLPTNTSTNQNTHSTAVSSGKIITEKQLVRSFIQADISNLSNGVASPTTIDLFRCNMCDKSFSRGPDLNHHVRMIHSVPPEKKFSCNICHKKFSHHSSVVNHQKLHSGVKPYACAVCHAAFSRKDYLMKHFQKHTTERPYVCVVCNKSFKRTDSLRQHVNKQHKNFDKTSNNS